jgi:hypothetical protein
MSGRRTKNNQAPLGEKLFFSLEIAGVSTNWQNF